jgi:predicted DNA binding CopG/RHH family protein
MKSKINFKEYEPIDKLDSEEKALWESLQSNEYQSILTPEVKEYYASIFEKSAKRNQASTIRLTMNDKLLAKTKAKEEGIPYQVLLASIIHKWLHGKLVDAR